MSAFFPHVALTTDGKFLLSLASSFSLVILSGLLLHWSGLGLGRQQWVIALAGLSIGLLGIAAINQKRRGTIGAADTQRRQERYEYLGAAISLTILVLIAGGAIGYAHINAVRLGANPPPQLWILEEKHAGARTAIIGVYNTQDSPLVGRLQVSVNGNILYSSSPLQVAPQGVWRQRVDLSPDLPERSLIEATLTSLEEPKHGYRRATLWVQ